LMPVILTAQKKDLSKPWFLVQITDPQFGMFENNNGFEKETALYEKAVSKINQLKPDFVVITGDLVNDPINQKQIAEFKRITDKINAEIPVYLTPGNHDVGQEPDKQSINLYIKNYGYDRFSFKHKGSLFIGFNSSIIKNDLPKLENQQYKWLKKKLKGSKKASHVILFCHYPFFIQSFEEPETYSNISPEKRNKYLSLFEANNVDALFVGHLHKNNTSEFGGIQWVITSAVGKPLGPDPSGMRIVKVYNNRIESNYYGLDEVPDNVMFKK
jgi:serine/threonine-protein phosphatase CPPED1